ncbi:MAG: Mrp/NBP35 family ATP-binding protein [Anaeromyxobacter sp.]|nr:Mrp/NBP35 family ATP-binding protein [Anaeromyxobacter sp.]MBL0274574.1 Mrp/NBP35 family ATP-binding protein [Anaeromyxobacter sp.]
MGAPPDLTFGHTARPNHRAPFARHVLLFTSGKGGVGKSTVAVNVASALAQRGLRVGVLDADVHGPSVPRLLQLAGERVRWNDQGQMVPAENFGLRVMSVGLTTPEADTPLAWRSAVAISALVQLLDDVAWGPLDVLVVDLPPGTGDVQLTLAQELHVGAAVVVTTPQVVATDDVRRALRLLLEVGVPVAGVLENMSWFTAPDTGVRHHPFGQGGGKALALQYGVPFLGELPLDPAIGASADAGTPIAAVGDEAQRGLFTALAGRLWEFLEAGAAPVSGG